ncbi:TIGR02996 domain-containing protein [Pyxidicoccus fallax]|uniref:TIGR02996 domain-containing protein n=1 Tax=Pyxidicoccus fallax TaxID=394095 RepID=A0A848LDG1_9BACT|nr:TIGR02996 domain-containing protein [Pyxidicoccus fallax]NMO17049.1 TIGR02996 domain-containing protein [Pyxidicoccus fallax]NPC83342.1 TIGR02996 domain-containing protein [Pyxidicoccus fallax]
MTDESLHGLLERALTAFEHREEEEALLRMLEAWRESRSERLAALVDTLSNRLMARMPPNWSQPSAPATPRHRPMDMARLLPDFLWPTNWGDAEQLSRQLEDFRTWPADPRLTPVLVTLTRMNISTHRQVLQGLCGLFAHLRDPRSLDTLRRLTRRKGPDGQHGQHFQRVLDAIIQHELVPLDEQALALCEALEGAIGARADTEARNAPLREALLARVYAHPDDDSARMVLADHLQEQGDALGEFIMLQYASQPDAARVRELLEKHSVTWQVPLGPHVTPEHTRFERGFPVAVQMNVGRRESLTPPGPAWGTVESIDWNGSGPPEAAAWLAHPHVHALKRLSRTRGAIGRGLGAHGLGVRSLELQGRLSTEAPDIFTSLTGLPHLTSVEIPQAETRDVMLCATSPMARRLKRFTVSVRTDWTLEATPSEAVTVSVALFNRERYGEFAAAIRHAVGFGTQGLRIRVPPDLDSTERQFLERATAAYAHVEWT